MNRQDGLEEDEELNRQGAKFAKEEEGRRERGEEKESGGKEEGTRSRIEPESGVDDLARQVIGAAIEVHRHLGPGFLEKVYEDALAFEFHLRGIPHERQAPVSVLYKDRLVGEGKLDFLVGGCLIVELKAVDEFASVHKAQVLSYLKATRLRLALLINFNVPVLRHGLQRVVLS